MAGISARFSNFAFVLFCYITNHLMTGPFGNSEFCFPRISVFPSTSSLETLRFSGNKIHCSPRDQSLSVKYYQLLILMSFCETLVYYLNRVICNVACVILICVQGLLRRWIILSFHVNDYLSPVVILGTFHF